MKSSVRSLYRLYKDLDGKSVSLQGWVRSNRAQKEFGFLNVNDGTFFETIQVVYESSLENFKDIQNFFNTIPALIHEVEVENPNTKVKGKVVLRGLQNFFV